MASKHCVALVLKNGSDLDELVRLSNGDQKVMGSTLTFHRLQ